MGILRATLARKMASLALVMVGTGMIAVGDARGDDRARAFDAQSRRIIHQFDFDERSRGNLEDVPKYWTPLSLGGFPVFATGTFDLTQGHTSAPSFRLKCEGRSIAYAYAGPDTRVRPATEYRVEGYVRTADLVSGRACLSAHFLDDRGRPIPGTVVPSSFLGGGDRAGEWTQVEMYLPAAPNQAHSIGVIAWVMQEQYWRTDVPARRHISRVDVRGIAWFDDIAIYALPRVALSAVPGNVLGSDTSTVLNVLLADYEDAQLTGHLRIIDAEQQLVEERTIPVFLGLDPEPTRVSLDHLPPGLYSAELQVLAGGTTIATRNLSFARVGETLGDETSAARAFGVVVDPRDRADPESELALLQNLSVRSAKLPLWSGLPEDPPSPSRRRATDHLFQELARGGFALTGVFAGAPGTIVKRAGAYPPPLLELLGGDPAAWRDHLAAVAVPYAGIFHGWQVGADGDVRISSEDKLETAIARLHDAMSQFVTVPQLAVPVPATRDSFSFDARVDQVTLDFSSDVASSGFKAAVERAKQKGPQRVFAYVRPLPRTLYQRLPRLAHLTQRLLLARHAGAEAVYTPQPWRTRNTPFGPIVEPTEDYLAVRTIADVVGMASPGPRLRIAAGVHCLAFYQGDRAVLAMWDTQAGPQGRRHTIQLGQASRQIDIWGRQEPLPRDTDGRHVVRLSPLPVFIDGVERWLIDLRSSVSLTPDTVDAGTELVTHTLELAYEGTKPLSGQISVSNPGNQGGVPREFPFQLPSGRVPRFPIEMQYPHNTVAGVERLLARIALSRPPYDMVVPLAIRFGLADVDVWATASLEGRDVVLTHVVTNRSSGLLDLRGTANVPGRERQYRPIANLAPGDTQTVEYRFKGAEALSGLHVRLALRELNDGPRVHNLELVIP